MAVTQGMLKHKLLSMLSGRDQWQPFFGVQYGVHMYVHMYVRMYICMCVCILHLVHCQWM